jgi:hypothetical protein
VKEIDKMVHAGKSSPKSFKNLVAYFTTSLRSFLAVAKFVKEGEEEWYIANIADAISLELLAAGVINTRMVLENLNPQRRTKTLNDLIKEIRDELRKGGR